MSPAALKALLRAGDLRLLTLVVISFAGLAATTGVWWWLVAGLVIVFGLVAFEWWKGAVFDGNFLAKQRRFATLVLCLFVLIALVLSAVYGAGPVGANRVTSLGERGVGQSSRGPGEAQDAGPAPRDAGDKRTDREPSPSDNDKVMAKVVQAVREEPDSVPDSARPDLDDIPTTPPDNPKPDFFGEVQTWADSKPGGARGLADKLCPPGSPAGPPCQLAALLLTGMGLSFGEGEPIEQIGRMLQAVQSQQYGALAQVLLRSPPAVSYDRALATIARAAGTTPEQLLAGIAETTPLAACAELNANTSAERARAIRFVEEKLFASSEQSLKEFRACLNL